MDRRLVITFTIVAVTMLSLPAFDTVAAGQGVTRYRSRSGGPTTRTYRSYSVSPGSSPGSEVVSESSSAGETGAIISRPPAVSNGFSKGYSRPSNSKPSYMRADSKARGRFGQ